MDWTEFRMKEDGFGLTGMNWNGRGCFGMEEIGFGLTGTADVGCN
jgi:hypothetical protein